MHDFIYFLYHISMSQEKFNKYIVHFFLYRIVQFNKYIVHCNCIPFYFIIKLYAEYYIFHLIINCDRIFHIEYFIPNNYKFNN